MPAGQIIDTYSYHLEYSSLKMKRKSPVDKIDEKVSMLIQQRRAIERREQEEENDLPLDGGHFTLVLVSLLSSKTSTIKFSNIFHMHRSFITKLNKSLAMLSLSIVKIRCGWS